MSKVTEISATVEAFMGKHKDSFLDDAKKRALARTNPPANDQELEWATQSEYSSIKSELVEEQVKDTWIAMFKETIEQANSSFDDLFVAAMLEAIQTSHRRIQSEFWLRMLKVMEKVSTAGNRHFDPRNEWTKDFLARMIFSYTHSTEVDILRNMSEDELFNFRTQPNK